MKKTGTTVFLFSLFLAVTMVFLGCTGEYTNPGLEIANGIGGGGGSGGGGRVPAALQGIWASNMWDFAFTATASQFVVDANYLGPEIKYDVSVSNGTISFSQSGVIGLGTIDYELSEENTVLTLSNGGNGSAWQVLTAMGNYRTFYKQ